MLAKKANISLQNAGSGCPILPRLALKYKGFAGASAPYYGY